ncbi:MAG TPA: HemK/PrmC family methyltransferase, partial [Candidatus Magasanikbacteria bacterium]|nr:HemK/PrmC family methyltransferase [Candidatus Magasanikbacteria bacterium]
MSHTIAQLLKNATQSIDRFDAEILLAHVLKKPREFIIAHPEYLVTKIQNWKMNRLIRLRRQGIPYAHLTGRKGFYGFDFVINKHTLVPRPETELLVELVINSLIHIEKSTEKITLIDIGTGSGCIPISILKSSAYSFTQSFAIDISKKALAVAKKNSKKHHTNITFLHGNLLEPLFKKNTFLDHHSNILLTANLPYLTQAQFDTEPTIQHEPIGALVAEDNGLKLYKELLDQINKLRANHSGNIIIFFEI